MRVEFDSITDKLIDAISMFAPTSNLSFGASQRQRHGDARHQRHGVARGWEGNIRSACKIDRKLDIAMCRHFRYDIQH